MIISGLSVATGGWVGYKWWLIGAVTSESFSRDFSFRAEMTEEFERAENSEIPKAIMT